MQNICAQFILYCSDFHSSAFQLSCTHLNPVPKYCGKTRTSSLPKMKGPFPLPQTAYCQVLSRVIGLKWRNFLLPLSKRWSISVRREERCPTVRKITESLPKKSAISPVYKSPPRKAETVKRFALLAFCCVTFIKLFRVSKNSHTKSLLQ